MSPLFLDAGYTTSSPESMSAEENHSSNAGSEREGEAQLVGKRGARRQEKNRDAARKSRRKQTERADELHEELQSLERSNSALQKEIASLKKEFQHYTTVLKHHEASCTLRDSAATLTSYLSVSSSGDCQTPSSSCQLSSSTQATAPSSSTSLTARLGLDCTESSHLTSSTSAPPATSLESSTISSAQLFTPSSSVTKPSSVPLSTVPSPHSLFCKDPPSLTGPRVTKSMPTCASLISSSVPSSYIRTPDQPSTVHKISPLPESACSPTHMVGAFQASFVSPSLNALPPYSSSVQQLHPGSFKDNSVNPSPVCCLSLSTPQNPALQSHSVSPQPSFPVQASYSQHNTTISTPLLSLLTNPAPVNVSQTTSNSSEGPPSDAPLPPQLSGDPTMDSLSEFLEKNEWILGMHDNYLYR